MEATYCVIDRSGSMANCLDDTIGGFNTFLADQPKESLMSIYLFDNEVIELTRLKKVSEIEPLNKTNYRPRGGTALLDAMGQAIKVASNCTADNITMVFLTDGAENSSRTYTKAHINDLIEDRKRQGWKFVFLAANQDAIQTGATLGIPEEASLTYGVEQTQEAFQCLSSAIQRSRTDGNQGVQFTKMERASSCPAGP